MQALDPWSERQESSRSSSFLDARNGFEQQVLQDWIHHHTRSGSEEFKAPCVSQSRLTTAASSTARQPVIALALPDDTLAQAAADHLAAGSGPSQRRPAPAQPGIR